DDIFCRQMTDLSWTQLRLGNGYYEFNPDYLATFDDEVSKLDENELEALKRIYQNRLLQAKQGKPDSRQEEGLQILGSLLF
ncbi:MAG: hypothetical protein U1D33_01275, partial [bacterium]|nr:hypothetical protein [bacterium]